MKTFSEVYACLRRKNRKNYLLLMGCCFFSVLLITAYVSMMRSPTVLTVLPEMLRSMNDYRMLIYAIVLIVVMIFNQSPQMITLRNRLTARFRNKNGAEKSKQKKGVA